MQIVCNFTSDWHFIDHVLGLRGVDMLSLSNCLLLPWLSLFRFELCGHGVFLY